MYFPPTPLVFEAAKRARLCLDQKTCTPPGVRLIHILAPSGSNRLAESGRFLRKFEESHMLVGFPKNRPLDPLPQSGSHQLAHPFDREFLRRSDVPWKGDGGKLHLLSSLYGAEVF
eukprot:jgi/Chrpa1/21752/Chrysochromulina_OHIO_Genome00026718-RA